MKKHKIGIALSGGGVRGMAHAGALQALDELNIKVNIISGTSSGAIIGVLYAAGVKPCDMIDIVKKSKLFNFTGLSFDFKGLLKTTSFRKILNQHVPMKTFEDLPIPVIACCTDFTNAKSVTFDSGLLMNPIIASCSIPLIFSPVIINGNTIVDGGLMNNFPVEPLVGNCNFIIGMHVNPLAKYKRKKISSLLERCFQMAISSNNRHKANLCDLFLEPAKLSEYSVFDMKHVSDIYNCGYQEVMKNKKELLSSVV